MALFNIRIEGTFYHPNRWNEIKFANILELFCLQWEPAPLAAEGLKARFDKLLRSSSKRFWALMQGAVFSGLCPASRHPILQGLCPPERPPISLGVPPRRCLTRKPLKQENIPVCELRYSLVLMVRCPSESTVFPLWFPVTMLIRCIIGATTNSVCYVNLWE